MSKLRERSLESEITFHRLPAVSWRMYSGITTETANVITKSFFLPFIRKTPDVCVLDTAWKLKPQHNALYFEESHRRNSCQSILRVSLKTSIMYIRNSRHYYSGKPTKCETGIRKYYKSILQKTKFHKYICCLIYDVATTYNI